MSDCCPLGYLLGIVTLVLSITSRMNLKLNEPHHEKTCLILNANNKGVNLSVHPRSLISAFIVRCLDRIKAILAKSEISSL